MALSEPITITPNPVTVGGQYMLSVTLLTWNYIGKTYTWADLKNDTWNDAESQWKE